MRLGRCGKICLAHDIVGAALMDKYVVFHSTRVNSKDLVDFLYQDWAGRIHAFQVTLGHSHCANPDHILQLGTRLGPESKFSLYYLVPEQQFETFVTKPVNPLGWVQRRRKASCDAWHVSIAQPPPRGW